jgi:hypothetical protein
MEDMLVMKCFVCGKIDSYRELTREQVRRVFHGRDRMVVAGRGAS